MHVLTLTFRALGRWLVRALCVLLILAALLWAGLRWGIVPRIDHFRPRMERAASSLLGARVHADAIAAEAGGLGFAFTVRGLRIDGGHGTDFRAARMRVLFSIPSLLRGRLRQWVIDEPHLTTHRPLGQLLPNTGTAPKRRDFVAATLWAWVLAQPEIVVRDGSVTWNAPHEPAMNLHAIQVFYRGGLLRRALRVDASPDSASQAPWHAVARLERAWIPQAGDSGHWSGWSGQGYVRAPDVDGPRWNTLLRQLGAPAAPHWLAGAAAGQAWARWSGDTLEHVSGTVAFSDSTLLLRNNAPALTLPALRGDIAWQRTDTGWHASLGDLQPAAAPAEPYPLGHGWSLDAQSGHGAEAYTLEADTVTLPALAAIAARVLPASTRDWLAAAQPQGTVTQARLHWRGALGDPRDWRLSGQARDLAVAAVARPDAQSGRANPGIPGVHGAALAWQVDAQGGNAQLDVQGGSATFPGVFAEPEIPLDTLHAKVQWKTEAGAIAVDVPALTLANADAAGDFHAQWTSGDAPGDPGTLTLDGTMARANGARVWRYLPLAVPADARAYVHDAITQGAISDAQVKLHGALRDFPFDQPGSSGVFRISGQVQDAHFAYVPRALQPGSETPWPALTELRGTLTFAGAGMQVRDASAAAAGVPGWRFSTIRADIADLGAPRVVVGATGQGQLGAALTIVQKSRIGELINGALQGARGDGTATLRLKLDLPVNDLAHAQVDGQVQLQGNAIQLQTDGVQLQNARGGVHFDEHGFAIQDARADFLGGSAQVSGGTVQAPAPGAPDVRIAVQGNATAAGLRAMRDWGPVPTLARAWHGQAAYTASIAFTGAAAQVDVRSDLRGLDSDLPAPFAKPADDTWPLHYTRRSTPTGAGAPDKTRWQLQVGQVLALAFANAEGATPPRGAIVVGQDARSVPTPPAQGVAVEVAAKTLDASRWIAALEPDADQAPAGDTAPSPYLPTRWRLQAGTLRLAGQDLHDVHADATREGALWNAAIQATEAAGRVRYTEGRGNAPGVIQARLERLVIARDEEGAEEKSSPTEVRSTSTDEDAIEDGALPALDLQVDRFVLDGRDLGALEVQASHSARTPSAPPAWAIRTLALRSPAAELTAHGDWRGGATGSAPGRTTLTLQLNLTDAGDFLTQLGFKGLLAHGKGSITGQLHWQGGPVSPKLAHLGGTLHMDVRKGRFLKTDPGGVGRLLGLLSLQALPRRLGLDFRDVFRSGFAFDSVTSKVQLQDGSARTDDFRMQGVNAAVQIAGTVGLADQTEHLRVTIAPELDAGTAALGAALINPLLGAGAFIAQLALKGPLSAAATHSYEITGTWDDPQFTPGAPPTDEAAPPAKQPQAGQ